MSHTYGGGVTQTYVGGVSHTDFFLCENKYDSYGKNCIRPFVGAIVQPPILLHKGRLCFLFPLK